MDADKLQRINHVVRAVGIKGELARIAKRLMKETPEYAQARKEGRAREWLDQEASSYADSAYELLQTRLQSLDP